MRRIAWLKSILLITVLAGLAGGALAAQDFQFAAPRDSSALAPTSTDTSSGILREIFGSGVFGEWAGGFESAPSLNGKLLGAAFTLFNSGMLIFGSLMFAYAAVLGTIRTATDGEVLGKKWSSVWVPVRFSLGTVLLLPTAAGYSLAQMAVIWLALQGTGIASATWKESLAMLKSDDGSMIAPDVVSPDVVRKIAANILRSEVCVADMNTSSPSGPAQFGLNSPPNGSTPVLTAGEAAIQYQWGSIEPSSGIEKDVCGSIRANLGTTFTSTGSVSNADLRVMRTAQFKAINAAIVQIRANDLPARIVRRHSVSADGEITASAGEAVEASDVIRAIDNATTAYLREMSGAANKLQRSYTRVNSDFIDKSSRDGWMTAGQWYYQIARVHSDLATAMRYAGDYKEPEIKRNGMPGLDPGVAVMIDSYLRTANRTAAAASVAPATAASANVGVQTGIFIDDGIGDWTKKAAAMMGYDVNGAAHPIVQLKSVGDNIMGTIEAVYAVKQGASMIPAKAAAGGVLGNLVEMGKAATIADSVWNNIISPIFYIIMLSLVSMFVFGCVLSLYLPLVPFIIWIGSILGWLTSIFEMMCAVPLWIAAQLHPEGENLVGKWGANGYMILLEIVMRPTLMIFGLLGSFVICEPFMRFLVTSFWNAASSVQAESVHGLPSLAIIVAIFVTLGLTTMHRIFALIHVVPNTIMRWLGGMGSSHDRSEQDQHNVYGAVTRMGGSAQVLMNSAGAELRKRSPQGPLAPISPTSAASGGHSGPGLPPETGAGSRRPYGD